MLPACSNTQSSCCGGKVSLDAASCCLITIIVFFLLSDSPPVCVFGCVNRAMAGPELLLDSSIRMWVVLPIVFITFFVGIIRHYVTQLLHSDKKVNLEQVSDR